MKNISEASENGGETVDEKKQAAQEKIELSVLEKNGAEFLRLIDDGQMGCVLSGDEIMYVFLYRRQYQCFIHKLDAEEGRHKSFAPTDRNRAMLKNLDSAADQLFSAKFSPKMDFMGVMEAAERGIIHYLDSVGRLPAEDVDFMAAYEQEEENQQ